jgi:hypothetical protein
MINKGDVCLVLNECPTAASTKDQCITVQSDGVLLSLFVQETAGTVDVNVYTLTKTGHEKLIDTFPQISAPTTELLLRKEVEVHNQIRVEVITSDSAKYDIRAKGVEAGISSVRIEGANDADGYGILVDSTARLLIPVALVDQNDISIINNNPVGGQTLWVGFKATITATSTATIGVKDPNAATPIPPGSSLGLNVTAGLTVYGITTTATCDVRIIQLGG